MEDTHISGKKKEAFFSAQKIAEFLTDAQNAALWDACADLIKLGAKIFISRKAAADPYCKAITVIGPSPIHFYSVPLSQIGIIMPSSDTAGEDLYNFTLGELRMVKEKGEKEGCRINLNNAIFFEVDYKYFASLSFLFTEYDEREPLKTASIEESWLKKLHGELKTNGGADLISQWEEVLIEKSKAVRAQNYDEAAKLRDQENNILYKLQEMIDKHFEAATV